MAFLDIRDCEFIPKPSKEPYKKLVESYKIEPQYCIFFEDIARNLKPAYELGMKTVWIKIMNLGQQNILTRLSLIIKQITWLNF